MFSSSHSAYRHHQPRHQQRMVFLQILRPSGGGTWLRKDVTALGLVRVFGRHLGHPLQPFLRDANFGHKATCCMQLPQVVNWRVLEPGGGSQKASVLAPLLAKPANVHVRATLGAPTTSRHLLMHGQPKKSSSDFRQKHARCLTTSMTVRHQ